MRTQIGKWGNSLALRLPKEVAEGAGMQEGSQVEVELVGGVLRVKRARPRYSLEALVKRINRKNIPDEILDDGPKGRELL